MKASRWSRVAGRWALPCGLAAWLWIGGAALARSGESACCHSEPREPALAGIRGEESQTEILAAIETLLRPRRTSLGLGLWPSASAQGDRLGGTTEAALRKRAEEYYALLQDANWGEAEKYVTAETREHFRRRPQRLVLGFRVDSVKLDSEATTGTVVTFVRGLAGPIAAGVELPQTSRWRLADGLWYLEYPKPMSLFGPASPAEQQALSGPEAEELKFKGHRYHLGDVKANQIKVARFPFTNVTDHVVSLQPIKTGHEALRVLTKKMEYQPGESGELAVEFNPTGYMYIWGHTFPVKTEPGPRTTLLTVTANVLPPGFEKAPESQQEKKPQ